MERLIFARNLLGLSQVNMAKTMNIPQTTYSHYEKAAKKLPSNVLAELTKIGIDGNWVITGEVNKNYCYEITATIQLNQIPAKVLAEKVGVTEAFINAIIQEQVSPSTEFFQKIVRTIGVEPQGDVRSNVEQGVKDLQPGGKDYAKKLLCERDILREELEQYKGYLGESQFENKKLEKENEKLKAEIAELKRRLGIE